MWVITHTLSGLALGAALDARNMPLWAVVVAALMLHLVLDLVPHWDYVHEPRRALWAAMDVAASAALLLAMKFVGGAGWTVVLAGVISALPDLDVLNALWTTEQRVRIFPSHWDRFPHGSAAPIPGTLIQTAVAVISLAVMVLV